MGQPWEKHEKTIGTKHWTTMRKPKKTTAKSLAQHEKSLENHGTTMEKP
jgi:hypothetical protein